MQPIVSLSSTEAEYKVLTDAAKDIVCFRRLLHKLGEGTIAPTILLSDNQSCIRIVNNPVVQATTKHIAIQHHFIRETANASDIQVEYTPTTAQLANFLTKPLPFKSFANNRHQAGIVHYSTLA